MANAFAQSASFAKNSRRRAKIRIGPRSWASYATRVSSLSRSSCRPPPRVPSDTFRIAPASSENRSTQAPDAVGGLFYSDVRSQIRAIWVSRLVLTVGSITCSFSNDFCEAQDPLTALPAAAKRTPHRMRNSDGAVRPVRLVRIHRIPPRRVLQTFHFPFECRCAGATLSPAARAATKESEILPGRKDERVRAGPQH